MYSFFRRTLNRRFGEESCCKKEVEEENFELKLFWNVQLKQYPLPPLLVPSKNTILGHHHYFHWLTAANSKTIHFQDFCSLHKCDPNLRIYIQITATNINGLFRRPLRNVIVFFLHFLFYFVTNNIGNLQQSPWNCYQKKT